MADQGGGQKLTDLLDEKLDTTQGEEQVAVGDLLQQGGVRGYGPLLLVPYLIALSPIAMIPGVAVAMGTILILVARV